ncbi:MAG: hypothetical protein ACRC0V_11650, partial [Fusobacteriaceae bacterium]
LSIYCFKSVFVIQLLKDSITFLIKSQEKNIERWFKNKQIALCVLKKNKQLISEISNVFHVFDRSF